MATVSDNKPSIIESGASIFKYLSEHSDKTINLPSERDNLELVMDLHWFFLYSRYHKENYNYKRHIGKWKYDATSSRDLLEKVLIILPIVASGMFPVAKFTNLANVFSGEKKIVVYCFPFGPSPYETGGILKEKIGDGIYWGSKKYPEP